MIEAVRDGTIDMIVSSHDPQGADTKRLPFEDAEAGAVGMETLLAAALRLYHDQSLSLIVSSHDPQGADTKRLPFEDAEAGAVGMETLLAAALRLYHDQSLSLLKIAALLSTNPAKILEIDAGSLKPGKAADFILVDLDEPWVLTLDMLHSRSKNTPFENARFQGHVLKTYVSGKMIYQYQNS